MARAIAGTFGQRSSRHSSRDRLRRARRDEVQGFADFAWIGGIWMVVCWIASLVLLPALVMRFAPSPRRVSSLFGRFVASAFGFRRPAVVCAIAAAVVAAVGVVSWRYVTGDPYEYDTTRLRSQAADAETARAWLRRRPHVRARARRRRRPDVHRRRRSADVAPLPCACATARDPIVGPVSRSRRGPAGSPPSPRSPIFAPRRRRPSAADDARRDLLAVRPPDELAAITARDLPRALATQLTERDGRIGYIVSVRPGAQFDDRDGRDLIRFADAVRSVHLPDGRTITAAGGSLLFADVLLQIQRDGPLVTALAAVGLVAMVLLVVGRNRRAAAVLVATSAGSLAMIAACAIAGLRINFLDFVALPITLGLGIDYAINVADRAAEGDPRRALRSTGGTVFVCSLTTMIGYTSLLVSDNLGIRGFGLASLIGEITCVVAALVIVPAIVALGHRESLPALAPALRESRA
jgi:hypothetical protein